MLSHTQLNNGHWLEYSLVQVSIPYSRGIIGISVKKTEKTKQRCFSSIIPSFRFGLIPKSHPTPPPSRRRHHPALVADNDTMFHLRSSFSVLSLRVKGAEAESPLANKDEAAATSEYLVGILSRLRRFPLSSALSTPSHPPLPIKVKKWEGSEREPDAVQI